MNQDAYVEKFPDCLETFCKNYDKKKYGDRAPAGAHSIYHLQTIDRDGNVTSERFAMNLLTNTGFNRLSGSSNSDDGSQVKLWIGKTPDGQTLPPPTYNDTALTSRITTIQPVDWNDTRYTYVSRSKNMFALQFDRDSGLIYQRSTVGSFMYEYNPSGFPDSVDISEVGLTFSAFDYTPENQALCTKATVVDANGDPSPITKNKDQRLIITVYFSAGIYASTINDLWSQGIYVFLAPASLTWSATGRGTTYGVYANYFQGNIQYANFDKTEAQYWDSVLSYTGMAQRWYSTGYMGKYATNVQTNSDGSYLKQRPNDISSILIENRHEYIDGIWLWDDNWRFSILDDHDKLPSAEELVSEKVYTNSPWDMSLSKTFALPHQDLALSAGTNTSESYQVLALMPINTYTHYGEFPVVDFNMTSSYMYNYSTKSWDIPDNFVNAPNAWYGSSFIAVQGTYITDHNGVNRWCTTFINSHTNIPITQIKLAVSGARIIATNAYWDSTQWHEISDLNNISDNDNGFNCQTARYYIDISDKVRFMLPVRDQQCHSYTPEHTWRMINITPNQNDGDFNDYTYLNFSGKKIGHKILSSDTNNWIAGRDYVVYPDISDTTGTSDKSIPLCSTVNTPNQINDANFYGDPLCRFATDDFIVIMHWANNKYGTDGQYRRQRQRFKVFRMYDNWNDTVDDPSNPAGIKDTYEMEFPVRNNTSSVSINNVWLSWSDRGYLVAVDTNGDQSTYCLKLYGGQDGYTPEVFKIPNARWGHVINRTSRVVYVHQDDYQQMSVYDLETETVISTFTIPDGYTKANRSIFGFGNCVYFTVRETSSGNLSTFVYLIDQDKLVHMPDWDDVALHDYAATAYVCQNTDGAYAPGSGMYVMEFDNFMITSSCRKIGNDNHYTYTYIYRADDPTNPKNLANNYITTSEMRAVTRYNSANRVSLLATCRDSIVLTPDGKHLLWLTANKLAPEGMDYYNNPSTPRYCTMHYTVLDIGYLLDGNKISDIPESQAGWWPGEYESPAWGNYYPKSGGITYWHKGIVITDSSGAMRWSPLEGWIQHKVTGTTRTIQSFNNPRRISGKNFTYFLSNGTVDPGV